MPSTVERALADALSLTHPDVAWSLPEILPSASDLRTAMSVLQAEAAPATPKHVTWCLAKLMMAFEPNVKSSAEETKLRAAVWLEACGDLGDVLWSKATLAAIQGSKWMPKPAEFRKLVERELDTRTKRLNRCKAMLAGHGAPASANAPAFVPDSRETILRTTLKWAKARGDTAKAARYERELAQLENRESEAWASEAAANEGEKINMPSDERPDAPVPLSASMQARTLRSTAQFHRAAGREKYADQLARQADALMPMQRTDIPGAEHGEAA